MQTVEAKNLSVRLSEIFTSIEGEGIYFGTKTMFVRFAGCPLKCHWCDTTYALPFESGDSVPIEKAKELIESSLAPNTFKVNFTGGEPLSQHEALIELSKHVRSLGLRTYLESACYDSRRFESVLPFIDICKIEFKLSDSRVVAPENYSNLLRNELECLDAALSHHRSGSAGSSAKVVYVKVVVSSESSLDEFERLVRLIFETDNAGSLAGFIIQPTHKIAEPSLDRLVKFYDAVFPYCPDVRVIPQLHKILGAR